MGAVPWWYRTIQAARYLGVAPWDLIEQMAFWEHAAVESMNAEARARKTLSKRRAPE